MIIWDENTNKEHHSYGHVRSCIVRKHRFGRFRIQLTDIKDNDTPKHLADSSWDSLAGIHCFAGSNADP